MQNRVASCFSERVRTAREWSTYLNKDHLP